MRIQTKMAGLTPAQQLRLERSLRTFGCADDDFTVVRTGAGEVHVTIGLAKGRPLSFTVSGDGSARS